MRQPHLVVCTGMTGCGPQINVSKSYLDRIGSHAPVLEHLRLGTQSLVGCIEMHFLQSIELYMQLAQIDLCDEQCDSY